MKINSILLLLLLVLISSCSNKGHSKSDNDDNEESYSEYSIGYDEESDDEYGNRFEDGTHSATVEYYNPETGFSNTYTLDVEVSDDQIVEIDFPNGGYLDDSHIDATELDDYGCATVYDDEGREFEVTIDY